MSKMTAERARAVTDFEAAEWKRTHPPADTNTRRKDPWAFSGTTEPHALDALGLLLGPDENPSIGWRHPFASDSSRRFGCEFCQAEHEDVTQIPHAADCPVRIAREVMTREEHDSAALRAAAERVRVLTGEVDRLQTKAMSAVDHARDVEPALTTLRARAEKAEAIIHFASLSSTEDAKEFLVLVSEGFERDCEEIAERWPEWPALAAKTEADHG